MNMSILRVAHTTLDISRQQKNDNKRDNKNYCDINKYVNKLKILNPKILPTFGILFSFRVLKSTSTHQSSQLCAPIFDT